MPEHQLTALIPGAISRRASISCCVLLSLLAVITQVRQELAGAEGGAWPEQLPSRPYLLHRSTDRTRLLALASGGAAAWMPTGKEQPGTVGRGLWDGLAADYAKHFTAEYAWEGPKSEQLRQLAWTTWLLGNRTRPGRQAAGLATLHDALRTGVAQVAVAERREREWIKGAGKDQRWGVFLDAGITLWQYALAYDYLAAIAQDDPAFDGAIVQSLYEKLADGAYRVLLDHMRGNRLTDWDGREGRGNNWNSREFVGVGMACLAMADRFRQEPVGSRRRTDFEDGLRLVRALGAGYLTGWYNGIDDSSYYYEGPHYLRYWSDYWIPFLDAHGRLFPQTEREWPALSLSPRSPMVGLMRAQAAMVMPTYRDRDGTPRWSNPPFDDTWIYHDDALTVLTTAAAIMPLPETDRVRFLSAVRRAGITAHPLLVGHPVWDDLARTPPAELPRADGMPSSGIAMLRTGSAVGDLHVALKNAPVSIDNGVPSLASHCHPDSGSLLAYRDAEPVLIDPGYGAKGWSNPHHAQWFTAWNRHNVLLVEEGQGYREDIRAIVGDSGAFILPVWTGAEARQTRRVSRCEQLRDAIGDLVLAEMDTPAHRRLVLVPDRDHILVIDRLKQPRRVKLCWWGDGHAAVGDPPTAVIDREHATATWSRGAKTATRIQVLLPTAQQTETAEGMYGPFWYDLPADAVKLTGMWVSSAQPTAWAVSLIQLAAKTAQPVGFGSSAEPIVEQGALTAVILRSPAGTVRYGLGADGAVKRTSAGP